MDHRGDYLNMAIQPMQFALKMVENAMNYADSKIDRTNLALITTRLKEAIEIAESERDSPPICRSLPAWKEGRH